MMDRKKPKVIPTDIDVLCGRGTYAYKHPGNQQLRASISAHAHEFGACQQRKEKTAIIQRVIRGVTDGGGRFLKLNPDSDTWYDGGMDAAKYRVGVAFRDALRPQNKERKSKTLNQKNIEKRDYSLSAKMSDLRQLVFSSMQYPLVRGGGRGSSLSYNSRGESPSGSSSQQGNDTPTDTIQQIIDSIPLSISILGRPFPSLGTESDDLEIATGLLFATSGATSNGDGTSHEKEHHLSLPDNLMEDSDFSEAVNEIGSVGDESFSFSSLELEDLDFAPSAATVDSIFFVDST